ncbi:DUF881 domain-containing protein [Nocardioides yefusunii]|uniref:DUF881 domain-containing protein n=1 Tax=Nocardioides yefusunii TaxID=2500546 RepID=A0ABW1R2J1_9ACTN|nr:DUF881 domain-containing protein [Nocardioides yefusunii]
MSEGAEPSPETKRPLTPSERRWKLATPVVVLLGASLCVVSAANSDGIDLRPSKFTDIASIVEAESAELTELNERAADLDQEVALLTASVGDRTVSRYNRRIAVLEDPAGLTTRRGAGVTVTLTDAPAEIMDGTSRDLNELVVHQQDIQAVVNALWRGGATAVTVQGQRIISTTGIKCSGNTVQLEGVPYSPPYVISAIGNQLDLFKSVEGDDYLDLYRAAAQDPEVRVGWDIRLESFLEAPAYDGVPNLSYAVPLDS